MSPSPFKSINNDDLFTSTHDQYLDEQDESNALRHSNISKQNLSINVEVYNDENYDQVERVVERNVIISD